MTDLKDHAFSITLNESSLDTGTNLSRTPKLETTSTTPPSLSPDKKTRTPLKFSKAGEAIYNRGKEFLNSVELKRQEIANNEHSFRPKINEKSQQLLSNALKEGRNPREKKKEEVKTEEPEEKKIKPKGDIKGFIDRNYTIKKPIEKIDELDKECTFKPKITDKSKELASSISVDLFEQAKKIEKRKLEKIQRAQKEKEDKELVGCTFAPQISKPYLNISPTGKAKRFSEVPSGYSKKPHKLFIDI